MGIVLKDILAVLPENGQDMVCRTDISLQEDKIAGIGEEPEGFSADKVIDGTDRLVIPGLISVTVLGENGAVSDGLSTACFVLGMEKGAELLRKYEAEGIFVDQEKNVYVTESLTENFGLEASGYVVFPLSS